MSVTFMAASGAESSMYHDEAKQIIWEMTPAVGGNTGPCRLGFYGIEGHGDSVLLLTWSSSAYIVNVSGTQYGGGGSGVFVPVQFASSGQAAFSGINAGPGWPWDLDQDHRVPCESGTVLVRFIEPSGSAVQTLNCTLRSVYLTVDDVVEDDTVGADAAEIIIHAFETSRMSFMTWAWGQVGMEGDSGLTGDTEWTRIDDGGPSNMLAVDDHQWEAPTHDYTLCISVSPQRTGAITQFGFMFRVDYV